MIGVGISIPETAVRQTISAFINFKPSNLTNWLAARANVLAGTSMARIGIIGDSTTAGQGAGSPGIYDGARLLAPPYVLSSSLSAAGIPSISETMTADGATIGLVPDADMDVYEPRVNLDTASWGRTNGVATLGGKTFNSPTGAGTASLTWNPVAPIDTIKVYYVQNTNFGTFSITDGSGTLGTQSCNGTAAIGIKTVTRALSGDPFSIQRTTGNALHILGWECYNSAEKEVSVLALGQAGVDTSGLIVATGAWSALNCYDEYNCDLHFLNIGINDIRNSITSATYKTNLQTIVTAMKAVGDVILVWPQPDLSTLGDQANRQNYRAAMYEIATTNDLPLIDLETYFTSIGGGASLYNDTVHLTAEGYAVVADLYKHALALYPGAVPASSWQIIGQYNDIGQSQQGTTAANVRVLTVSKAKLAADNVTALKAYGRGYYVGGSGGVEVNVGNDVPTRVAAMNGSTLLGVSASPVSVVNGSGLTELAEFTGLSLSAGATIDLQKERVVTAGQFSNQTTVYATGTIPTGVGRRGDNGTGGSDLGTAAPTGLAAGSLEGDVWVGFGQHPAHTYIVLGHSIAFNNSDAAIGDGGLSGAGGRSAAGGGMFRRGFRAAALATGTETPLLMMAKPAAQIAVMVSDGTRRRASFPLANTLVVFFETNDLDSSAGNKNAGQVAAYYETVAAQFRADWAAGPNGSLPCYVIACTPLPRGADGGIPTTTQTRIEEFYDLVVAGIDGFDGYWDLNSLFAVPGTPWKIADTALFNADLLHPSAAGHIAGAAYISDMIQQATPWIS